MSNLTRGQVVARKGDGDNFDDTAEITDGYLLEIAWAEGRQSTEVLWYPSVESARAAYAGGDAWFQVTLEAARFAHHVDLTPPGAQYRSLGTLRSVKAERGLSLPSTPHAGSRLPEGLRARREVARELDPARFAGMAPCGKPGTPWTPEAATHAELVRVITTALFYANEDVGCPCDEECEGPLEGCENDSNHNPSCPRHLQWILRGMPDEGAYERHAAAQEGGTP